MRKIVTYSVVITADNFELVLKTLVQRILPILMGMGNLVEVSILEPDDRVKSLLQMQLVPKDEKNWGKFQSICPTTYLNKKIKELGVKGTTILDPKIFYQYRST